MTINEIIQWCNDHEVSGDQEIVVHAFGGMRHGKQIKSVGFGIDWDMGKIVLHPTIPLTIKARPRDCHGKTVPCKHDSTHWRVDPGEKHIGRSVEVCNECGMSRKHWEQGDSGWSNADIDDFPLMPEAK